MIRDYMYHKMWKTVRTSQRRVKNLDFLSQIVACTPCRDVPAARDTGFDDIWGVLVAISGIPNNYPPLIVRDPLTRGGGVNY